MSFNERVQAANERMVQISEIIDKDSEAARLQGSVLAGGLLGGWTAALAFEFGYSPLITATMITVGVIGGLASRTML